MPVPDGREEAAVKLLRIAGLDLGNAVRGGGDGAVSLASVPVVKTRVRDADGAATPSAKVDRPVGVTCRSMHGDAPGLLGDRLEASGGVGGIVMMVCRRDEGSGCLSIGLASLAVEVMISMSGAGIEQQDQSGNLVAERGSA